MMLRQSLKDGARALSLANLFFTSQWIALLDKNHFWFGKFSLFSFNNILALMLDVLILGATFFGALQLVRYSKNRRALQIARGAFLLIFFILFGIAFLPQFLAPDFNLEMTLVRAVGYFNITELRVLGALITSAAALLIKHRYRYGVVILAPVIFWLSAKTEFQIVLMVLTLGCLLIFVYWGKNLLKAAIPLVLILFPFFIWTFMQGSYFLSKSLTTSKASVIPAKPSSIRIVWIIFDGLDYSLAFSKRPNTLTLKEFDRLRAQSLCAMHAYPPAGHTMMSMPALITGRLISKARPINPSDMLIHFDGSDQSVSLAAEPNIFSEAQKLNYPTALVGWAIPFQRIIGGNLNSGFGQEVRDQNLFKNMVLHFCQPLNKLPMSPVLKSIDALQLKWERQEHLNNYHQVMKEAKRVVSNADYGLALIHLPVPHPPGIYNRANQEFELEKESSYLDSLALADYSLGELRRAMEQADEWDKTILIVSSDHWWRPYIWKHTRQWTEEDNSLIETEENVDHRVPFLIKMPEQKSPLNFEPAFNTVLTKDLILRLLGGELSSVENLKSWIEQNRSIGESPYSYEKISE